MDEYHVFKLDKIPKGSLLEKYLKELPKNMKRRKDFLSFVENIFLECLKFLIQQLSITYLPQITLKFVHTREQFEREEQRESKTAKSKEVARLPAHALVAGNKFRARMYVDLEHFKKLLLKYGYLTFLWSLVDAYMHELIHIMFPEKYEQEIYDLQCHFMELFLGVKIPEEKKKLRASDYYSKAE